LNTILLVAATVLGFLSFFEPCTIATHTLFAVRAHHDTPKLRWLALFQLMLSRALLLMVILGGAAMFGLTELSSNMSMLILIVIGLVYLVTRKIYLPVPHLEFYRLLPLRVSISHGLKLGLTLPACTLPLVIITAVLSALTQRPAVAMFAGVLFALMFTLPTLWSSTHKLNDLQRTFLGKAANLSPYVTTLLLWSCAFVILKSGV
jgi:cytochrome c-type biogenesis protein